MRSLLECVSCLGTATHEVSMMEEVVTVAVTPATEEEEETRSLMPAVEALLCSITEDNIMAENRKKTPTRTTTTVGRGVKRKSSSGSRSNVHVRSYSNDRAKFGAGVPTGVFPYTFHVWQCTDITVGIYEVL
ncbi:hypothetical protein F3Y22_tig00000652pilonHSYRG00015 [Hibiscus syriacus]|uniref:Uncharacterized protein n=1 Tax=Hibiscus syriacus TaxID=106335 RepID=A0A6A3CZR8_HIBSY|nr:hypothetical protein F3Y22_tig00000652pilonHSYRG00015 [Hibiscus syriacus]